MLDSYPSPLADASQAAGLRQRQYLGAAAAVVVTSTALLGLVTLRASPLALPQAIGNGWLATSRVCPASISTGFRQARVPSDRGTSMTGVPRSARTAKNRIRPVGSMTPRFVFSTMEQLDLTPENVEIVLDEVRPYLQADGGSVDFVEIEDGLVKLRLRGACSSCASSSTTMQLGIKRRLQERIAGVLEVVDVGLTEEKLEVTVDNIEKILDEIRPYLVGASGGSLDYVGGLKENNIKIKITGPAAKIMTVRVAIQQKIKEKFPAMMRVELVA